MAFADIYNIEERLQRIDSRVLRIDFDNKKLRHKIVAWDHKDECEYIAFTVPAGQLDARVETEFYRIRNPHYNGFDELRAWEAQIEREQDKKITDMATDLAETIQSSFRHKPSRSVE